MAFSKEGVPACGLGGRWELEMKTLDMARIVRNTSLLRRLAYASRRADVKRSESGRCAARTDYPFGKKRGRCLRLAASRASSRREAIWYRPTRGLAISAFSAALRSPATAARTARRS